MTRLCNFSENNHSTLLLQWLTFRITTHEALYYRFLQSYRFIFSTKLQFCKLLNCNILQKRFFVLYLNVFQVDYFIIRRICFCSIKLLNNFKLQNCSKKNNMKLYTVKRNSFTTFDRSWNISTFQHICKIFANTAWIFLSARCKVAIFARSCKKMHHRIRNVFFSWPCI